MKCIKCRNCTKRSCNIRCWALSAAFYNIFACMPAVTYLLIVLITYSRLNDFRQSYDDSLLEQVAKQITTATVFMWCAMEATGIIVSIRCVIGIKRDRVDLVTQYIIWKACLTIFYGVNCMVFYIGSDSSRSPVSLIYPGTSFVVDVILFIIIFVYYTFMPDDSSSDEEGF